MVNLRKELRAGKDRIEQAIAKAEEGTTGEIVLAVCRKAGNYGRYESFVGFLAAMIFLIVAWALWQGVTAPKQWASGPMVRFNLLYVCVTLLLGFVVGQLVAIRFPKLVTLFIPKRVELLETEHAAVVAYRQYKVSKTTGGTGVLIFIAEVERTVVVLGDSAISACVQDSEWEAIRDRILEGIRTHHPVDGLEAAVGMTGELLCRHLPCTEPTENELENRVYFL